VAALVVATEQVEGFGVPHLERPQVKHTLDREVASIDVVAQKEVACGLGASAHVKELHEVVKLTVDVPANCARNGW